MTAVSEDTQQHIAQSALPVPTPLAALDRSNRPLVGGKAATLGALVQAGIHVPPGFCLPPVVDPPDAWWQPVLAAYQRLAPAGQPVAVRSSALLEDGPQRSFAGQFASVLDVDTQDALKDAVRHCWQSAASARVRAYASAGAPSEDPLPVAVIVQRQVHARLSGILFTRDPRVTKPDRSGAMFVEFVAGSGDELAAGRAQPTRFRLDSDDCQPLSAADNLSLDENSPALTHDECRRLYRLGQQVEELLGPGQDIEWCLGRLEAHEPERLYLLQARPITPLGAPRPLDQHWTRANVGEVLPNPVTPLTWSVFRQLLTHATSGYTAPLAPDGAAAWPQNPAEGLRLDHGRVQLRLDALLDSFCYLPGVTPQVLHQVLGVELPPAIAAYRPALGLAVRLAQVLFWLDALGPHARLDWLQRRLGPPPATEWSQLDALLAWSARCFALHLKATAYAIAAFAWLQRLAPQSLSVHPLAGNLHSAEHGQALWTLAADLHSRPALAQSVREAGCWSELAVELPSIPGGPAFLDAFQGFLQTHGARAVDEFELAVPRWHESPDFLLTVLQRYLSAMSDSVTFEDGLPVAAAVADLPPAHSWTFRRILTAYRRYVQARERIKYRLIDAFGRLRQIMLAQAPILLEHGLEPEDVFYLRFDELRALSSGVAPSRDWPAIIAARRAQLSRWRRTEPAASPAAFHNAETVLHGLPASPGRAAGRARVLHNTAAAGSLQPGEILVAPHTDPGWTPLFLTCAAVVTELGGFLSHGATVAREYGLPCVVSVPAAASRIRTGDWLQVDGDRGRITILPA